MFGPSRRGYRVVLRALAMVTLASAGCVFARPSDKDLPAEVIAQSWYEPAAEVGINADQTIIENLDNGLLSPVSKEIASPEPVNIPRNILCLSAGGKFGSYPAGILCGWTARGDRPTFDIVTGSSSGAILAVYAFLGPKYDCYLKQFFTETDDRDIYRIRPTLDCLKGGSLGTSAPLKRVIDQQVNEELLADLRAAHAEGRRLYIATNNSRAKRVTVWDVGALACSGRPDAGELVRKVILAACSIPGLVPPVMFEIEVDGKVYLEEHSDGGAVTQSFVCFGPSSEVPPGPWLQGTNVYCIASGKLFGDPSPRGLRILGRIGSTVSASLYSLYRAEMMKIYALCATSGANYHLTAIPQDYPLGVGSMNATKDTMMQLFNMGYQRGYEGNHWRHHPPGLYPREQDTPRTGLTYLTRPAGE